MSFRLLKRFTFIPEVSGRYYSFPTACVNEQGVVVLSYRDACVSGKELPSEYNGHGENGDMFILGWNSKSKERVFHYKVYDHQFTGENEQNTILSTTGEGDVFLFSRQHGKSNKVYFAASQNGGQSFSFRQEVSIKEFEFLACYGKIRKFENFLVAPVYGVSSDYDPGNRRCGAAWIYSEKTSFEWKLGGWISHPLKGGPSFNETALFISEGQGVSVSRSGEGGEMLYTSFSKRGLKKWSAPVPLGFRGEAPELHRFGSNKIGLSYRGFSDDGCFFWGLRVSKDFGKSWGDPFFLDEYSGSRFHGGYGDIVPLGENQWLGVFYSPGKSGLPAIQGVCFAFD
ncbi:MAG: sialidase family protein [Nitrospinota bacterium]